MLQIILICDITYGHTMSTNVRIACTKKKLYKCLEYYTTIISVIRLSKVEMLAENSVESFAAVKMRKTCRAIGDFKRKKYFCRTVSCFHQFETFRFLSVETLAQPPLMYVSKTHDSFAP